MINLRFVIQKYPECMNSKEKLFAILNDLFPGQRRMAYVLTLCYDCGIIDELKHCEKSETADIYKYAQHLILRYGTQEQLAEEAVELWCNAFDIKHDGYGAPASTPLHILSKGLKVGTTIEARVEAVLDTILIMDVGVLGEHGVLPKAYYRKKDISVGDRITTIVKSYCQEGKYPYWKLSAKIKSPFHTGDRVQGTVTHIYDRVAEVTLDDTEIFGLLHITELSWGLVWNKTASIADYICLGEKIGVYVKEIQEDRVILSRLFFETDPLRKLAQQHISNANKSKNTILSGIIEAVYPHGFFVDLGEGLVGLVHESQYESDVQYEEGQHVTVSVNSIDEGNRRISLHLIH